VIKGRACLTVIVLVGAPDASIVIVPIRARPAVL